ncbi:MAG: DEAD/DEAH box helicase [Oligoflexia bacterium]|nr:DEAD/DEAH box helicase [Oligoflexia bacterium]
MGLEARLRPYQLDGFRWLCRLASWGVGACLADDMGLGKTVQALALLLSRASLGPALVVCPTSVCAGWREQSWRFTPDLVMYDLRRGDRQAMLDGLIAGDVVVCSYGLLVSEQQSLAAVSWDTVILDESQSIKNPQTQRHKAARSLSAGFRLALTGTPVENRLEDLAAQMAVLNPGLLGSAAHFRSRFARPVAEGDREALRQLRHLVHPVVLRRTKAEVLQDLPEKTVIDVPVQLQGEEADLYESIRRQAQEATGKPSSGDSRFALLAWLTRLRLAACHPLLALPTARSQDSAKLRALAEIVDSLQAGGHRALLFSQFTSHLDLIQASLDQQGITWQRLDGSTPPAQREQRIAAFQRGEGLIFLISLRAGGFGLNLTAADYVIHMDPWWNPAVETQATDRAHRIGQSRPVTVYRLFAQDTVEERILELQHEKRQVAEALMEGADTAVGLGLDELRAVLLGG